MMEQLIGAFAAGFVACFFVLVFFARRRSKRQAVARRLGGQNSTEPVSETAVAVKHGPNGKEKIHAL
jgi:hypothetical protein